MKLPYTCLDVITEYETTAATTTTTTTGGVAAAASAEGVSDHAEMPFMDSR